MSQRSTATVWNPSPLAPKHGNPARSIEYEYNSEGRGSSDLREPQIAQGGAQALNDESITERQLGGKRYLNISGLTKQYGELVALQGVDLEINEGEFICFLGPSGCGKTTLLRAIAGLNIQTRGRIEQADSDISALPPGERDFGIVFQSYALFPNLTVYKNIAYGLENLKTSRATIKTRVAELLDLVGLSEYGRKYPGQLSGGEQQRVALARAIATSPGLLLLDEPLSALDAKVRVYLRHEIKQLQRRIGVTTIMVTHDQDEALTMADRIVVMNQGLIEQVGTPMQTYRHPRTPFVAGFIGAMNFLHGTTAESGSIHISGTGFEVSVPSHEYAPGRAVTIAVRPEKVILRDAPSGNAHTDNQVRVRIEWLEFLGSYFRADLYCEELGKLLPISHSTVSLLKVLRSAARCAWRCRGTNC